MYTFFCNLLFVSKWYDLWWLPLGVCELCLLLLYLVYTADLRWAFTGPLVLWWPQVANCHESINFTEVLCLLETGTCRHCIWHVTVSHRHEKFNHLMCTGHLNAPEQSGWVKIPGCFYYLLHVMRVYFNRMLSKNKCFYFTITLTEYKLLNDIQWSYG